MNSHPFSSAAAAAMIRSIARSLALAGIGRGGGGSGGVPPAAAAADGGCGPDGSPLPPDPSLLSLPGQDGQQQGGQSFTPGTRVLLANGKTAPISSLRKGSKVLARDTRTGKNQPEKVTAVLVHRDHDLYDLTVKTGHRTGVIHTTASHLFWDPAARRWVKAVRLRKGEPLQALDGTRAVAWGGTTPRHHDGQMWDLTIPGNNDHDFYVLTAQANGSNTYYAETGGTPVLVHNDNGCGPDVAVRDDMANSGMRPGRGGKAYTTQAGLEYDKHQITLGMESPKRFLPRVGGRTADLNTAGQKLLDEIAFHPNGVEE